MPSEELPPRDFPALQALIAERAGELPRRLMQVASYAVERPDDIAFGTVASAAAQAGVQPSALVRFAQAMGYRGFSELQEVFRGRLRDKVPTYKERLALLRQHQPGAFKAQALFEGFSEASEKSLARLREKLDGAMLETAVAALAEADTIYLVGLRRSYPVASGMAYAFGKLGVKYILVDGAGGLAPEASGFGTGRDAMFAVSFAPYASETIALATAAAARGVPVIAITDSAFSPLARLAQPWFEVAEANFEGFRSLAATLALAMSIAVAVAERRGNGA